MSDRPTPETDAAWKEGNAIREWTCRKMERERDEAREEIEALRHEYHGAKAMAGGFKDKIKSLTEERDELRDILRKFLEIIPEPECHDFGHTKEERHTFFEKCPVMERYHALIAQAEEAAK